MFYLEVGTVSRSIEENESIMPYKALKMAMLMAKEVHREMKVFRKACFAYSVAVSCYSVGAYNKSQRIQFEQPCDDIAFLEKLVADCFEMHVKKGIPVNSIYVAAEGVHSVEFGMFL